MQISMSQNNPNNTFTDHSNTYSTIINSSLGSLLNISDDSNTYSTIMNSIQSSLLDSSNNQDDKYQDKSKNDAENPNDNKKQTDCSQVQKYLQTRLIQILKNNRYDEKALNNPVNKRLQKPQYYAIFINNHNYLIDNQINNENNFMEYIKKQRCYSSLQTIDSINRKIISVQNSLKQQNNHNEKEKLQFNQNYLKKVKCSLKQKAQSKIFQSYQEIYTFVQNGVMSYYFRQLKFDLPEQEYYDQYLFPYCPDFDDYLYKEINRQNEVFEFQFKPWEQIAKNKQNKNLVQLNIKLKDLYTLIQLIIQQYKVYLKSKLTKNQKNYKINSQIIYQFIDNLSLLDSQTQYMLTKFLSVLEEDYEKVFLPKLTEKSQQQLIINFTRWVHTQLLNMVEHICLFNFIMGCQTLKKCQVYPFDFKYYLLINQNNKFKRSQIQELSFLQQKIYFFYSTLNQKQPLKSIYILKNQDINQRNRKIIENIDKKQQYQFSFRLFYKNIYIKDEDVYIQTENQNKQNHIKKIQTKNILLKSVLQYQCNLGQFIYSIIEAMSDTKNEFLQSTYNIVRFLIMNLLTFLYYSLLQRVQIQCKVRYGKIFYQILMDHKKKHLKYNNLEGKFKHIQNNSYLRIIKYIQCLSLEAKKQQSSNVKKFHRIILNENYQKMIVILIANNVQKNKYYSDIKQFFQQNPKFQFIYKRMKKGTAKQSIFREIIENINNHYNFETNNGDYFYLTQKQKESIYDKPFQIYECIIKLFKDQLVSLSNMERFFDRQTKRINTQQKTLAAGIQFNKRFQSNLIIILKLFNMITMIPFYTFQTQRQKIKNKYFVKKIKKQIQQTNDLKHLLRNLDQLYIFNYRKIDHEYLCKASPDLTDELLKRYQRTTLVIDNQFIDEYRLYLKNKLNKESKIHIQKQHNQLEENKNLIYPPGLNIQKGIEPKKPKLFKKQLHQLQVMKLKIQSPMEINIRFWSIFNSHQTLKIIRILQKLTSNQSSKTFLQKQLLQKICNRFRINHYISKYGHKDHTSKPIKQFGLPKEDQKITDYVILHDYENDINNSILNTRERQ